MPAFLLDWRVWAAGGAAAVVIALVALFGVMQVHIAHQEAEIQAAVTRAATAEAENVERATVLKALVESDEAVRQAEAQAADYQKALQSKTDQIQRTINASPPSDDGPIAPVLGRTLDSLRALAAPASAAPDHQG